MLLNKLKKDRPWKNGVKKSGRIKEERNATDEV
jgi:hypothetical protein